MKENIVQGYNEELFILTKWDPPPTHSNGRYNLSKADFQENIDNYGNSEMAEKMLSGEVTDNVDSFSFMVQT